MQYLRPRYSGGWILRVALHRFLSSLPARLIGGGGQALSIGASLWPERIKQWLGDNVTPEHIRIVAIPCAAIFAVYWLLLLWLKPKIEPGLEPVAAQLTFGDGSHAIGTIENATFNNLAAEPALHSAAASQTVEILRAIETKYCRKGYVDLLGLIEFHGTLRNNIIIVVGGQCGKPYVTEEQMEKAHNFFEGGGTILTTNMNNFSEGPMRELTLPRGEVVYVNFCKQAGEIMEDLSNLALSPFVPTDVGESLQALRKAIDRIFSEMITFLNDRLKKQRVRLIAAVNEEMVVGGLSNEFMDRAVELDAPLSHLREAIRRSLSHG